MQHNRQRNSWLLNLLSSLSSHEIHCQLCGGASQLAYLKQKTPLRGVFYISGFCDVEVAEVEVTLKS